MTEDNEQKARSAPRGQRVFFALWPDDTTRRAILDAAEAVIRPSGGRAVKPENLHLTLRFIGQADAGAMARLRRGAERVRGEPLSFELDRFGFWPEPAVLWLGCGKTPSELLRLVVNLNTELGTEGFLVETRPFRPHVTLARQAVRAPEGELSAPITWTSDSFSLVASETLEDGVRYRVLDTWPLGKR